MIFLESNTMMIVILIACLFLILLVLFAKPLRVLFRVLFGALWGGVLLVLCNAIGLPIGFNLFNLAFVSVLGLPGVFGLVALGLFL